MRYSKNWFLALILVVFFVPCSYGQYISLDNQSGYWTQNSSWGELGTPGLSVSDVDIYCNGELIALNCLDFDKGTLYVNDTLSVNGNLELKNNARLEISETGILIVYGDYTSNNQVEVENNGLLLVAGNFQMLGADNQGYFVGEGETFIFDADPELKAGDLYVDISCTNYEYFPDSCGYGSLDDFMIHPAYEYYQSLGFTSRVLEAEENSCQVLDFDVESYTNCIDSAVVYKFTSVGYSESDYDILWDFGEDASPAKAYGFGPHSITYTEVGLKDVSVTVSSDLVISKPACIEIVDCSINLDFESDLQEACILDTLVFTNASSGLEDDSSIIWNFGEDATPVRAEGAGPHKVVYSSYGLKDVSIQLNNNELIKEAYLQISTCNTLTFTSDKIQVCVGDSVSFWSTTDGLADFDTIVWSFGENAEPSAGVGSGPFTVTYLEEGEVDISMELTSNLVAPSTKLDYIQFDANPITSEIFVPEPQELNPVYYLDIVSYNSAGSYAVNGNEGASFSWSIDKMNFDYTGDNILDVLWDVSPGDYYITVQEISQRGCMGSISEAVVLVNEEVVETVKTKEVYAFTPNEDGFNDYWVIDGIDKYPKASINVYDRQGKNVFKCDGNYLNDWDGRCDGELLDLNTYYFVIDLSVYKERSIKGIITLLH